MQKKVTSLLNSQLQIVLSETNNFFFNNTTSNISTYKFHFEIFTFNFLSENYLTLFQLKFIYSIPIFSFQKNLSLSKLSLNNKILFPRRNFINLWIISQKNDSTFNCKSKTTKTNFSDLHFTLNEIIPSHFLYFISFENGNLFSTCKNNFYD